MKADHSVQINFIKDRLRKGQDRKEILQSFTKTYKVKIKTFDTRLKAARIAIQSEFKQIEQEANKSIAKDIEALKSKIMSSVERQEYLTRVLNGEIRTKVPFVIGGKIMEYPSEPSLADRLKALTELNKMQGDYAPQKIDVKTGEPVRVFVLNKAGDRK